MTLYVPLKLKDSANLQEFETSSAIANQDELYLAYQVGQYLISGDSSDIGSLTMDSSGGTQAISGTFTDTVYDSAVGTGGSPGSFLTFSQTNTTLRTNLGTITPVDSDYRIPVYKTNNSTAFSHQGDPEDELNEISANLSQVNFLRGREQSDYAEILNVSGNNLRIKIPSERNAIFDRFIGNSINQHDSDVDGYATHDGTVEFGEFLYEPPKMTGEVSAGTTRGRYEDSDKAYVINFRNVNFGGTNYGSHGAETEYENGNVYVNALTQENFQTKIKEMDSDGLNALVDRLNSRIATSDYLGSYRLGSSAPSGDYTVNLANVMTDTRTDGSSTAYNIYQRTTQSAPTQVLPFAIKRSNGDSGDYQGLQLMTDRQIQQSLGLRARNRLGTTGDDAGTFVGNYKLLSSAAGTPTDLGFTGTWAARGTATDTRQAIVDANYSRNRVSTYSRLRESTFSADNSRTRSSNYSDDYSRVRSSAYSDTYTVNRESNYSVGFVGDYSRNFTRLRSSNFTRTRESTFNYTRARASTFTGNYSRVITYEGNFLGNYTRTSTVSTTDPQGNPPSGNFTVGGGNHIWNDNRFEAEKSIIQVIDTPSGGGMGSRAITVINNGSQIYFFSSMSSGAPSNMTGQTFNTGTSGTFYWADGNNSVSFSSGQTFIFGSSYGSNTESVSGGTRTYSYYGLKYSGSVTNNYIGDYTRTSTRNSPATLSYSRTRASTFTGNYSRTLDYLGNYSRNFLGEYARDFTRTTPDAFTRDFTGNYSREFSRTRSSAYTRASQSSFAGNYTGNFQGNYTGNFIGDFVGPRVLTAQGSTDNTIYSNTLQVLGTETHTFNTDGTFASTTFTTPITTAPEGTKAIIVTGGIGTNNYRYTKFSGCEFRLGFPNDVTLTEIASASDPDTEYTFDSVIYGGNIGDNLNSSRQFSLNVSFTNQTKVYGAGIRVLFLNKDFKSGTLSSGTDRTWVSQTNITNTVGYYSGGTTFTNYAGGISVFTATIYDAPNHSAAIGAYTSGAITSTGYNNASLTHGGNRDSIHGYKLQTGSDANITPGARRFRQDFGETLLAATFQEDAFVDNVQDYLRQSTRSSLVTSTRTSTRTGTSRDASGEFATSYTGNFLGNFTGDYTRFANTTNEGNSYGGSLNWSAFDENGDSILTLVSGTTLSANTHSYLSFDGNSMSISFDFNSFAVENYPTKSNSYASQLSVKTNTFNVIPPDTEITFYWADSLGPSTQYKWMRIVVPEDYNVGRPSQTGSGTASNGGPTLLYHTFTVEDGLEMGVGEEGNESPGNTLTFTATPGSASGLLRVRANETSYTRDSTRTSTRTSMTFTGNYSRNFEGNYSRNYTRTRTSTYLGSDTFSRTFAGNYVGNYSRDFTRTFTGNYSRNFVGNYQGNYANNYLGDYSRTFIGNYAGNSIGSGNTNIETYTLYVRTA